MKVNDPPLCEAAQRLVHDLVTEFGDVFDSLSPDEMRDALLDDLGERVAAQRQRGAWAEALEAAARRLREAASTRH